MRPHEKWLPYVILGGFGAVFVMRLWRLLARSRRVVDCGLNSIEVTLVQSEVEVEALVGALQEATRQFPVVGLDCEWVEGREESENAQLPVSLVQLAVVGRVIVVQVNRTLPTDAIWRRLLGDILADSRILKVGVGIDNDVRRIQRGLGLTVTSFLDLRFLFNSFTPPRPLTGLSLAHMSESLLGISLDKSQRLSDWTATTLSHTQVSYAALDASVSLGVLRQVMVSSGATTAEVRERMAPYINHKYKSKGMKSFTHQTSPAAALQPTNSRHLTAPPQLTSAGKLMKYIAGSRSEIYSNGRLLAPDGALLCTCSVPKLTWYTRKGLGEFIDEKSVRLFFEPANRPSEDAEYYKLPKDNKCAVCGATHNLLRKNVVPVEYRKHFPERLKSHLSHDTLPLCVPCHVQSNTHDIRLRRQLAAECDAPLGAPSSRPREEQPARCRAKHSARALQTHMHVMPASRVQQLKLHIAAFYKIAVDDVDQSVIDEACNIQFLTPNKEVLEPHGLKVCQHFVKSSQGLEALKQRWRAHFIDCMRPEHLPELWSVQHRPKFKGELIDDCSEDVQRFLHDGGKWQRVHKKQQFRRASLQ